jgi:GntR family transcriptional repressor for pyruvate dehydrogenase complex
VWWRPASPGWPQSGGARRGSPNGLGDPAAFTEADILFHLGIALATGNSMIRVQMEGLRSVQREVSELFSRRANRTEADWYATIDRHQALFDAIAAGDADLAEQKIVAHFEAADIASLEVADRLGPNLKAVPHE